MLPGKDGGTKQADIIAKLGGYDPDCLSRYCESLLPHQPSYRGQKKVPHLGDATAKNDDIGIKNIDHVDHTYTQVLSRPGDHFNSQVVAIQSRLRHLSGSDGVYISGYKISKYRVLAITQTLFGLTGDGGTGSQHLQAAGEAAIALRTTSINGHMTYLPGSAAAAQVKLAAYDNTTTDAGAHRNVDKVIRPPAGSQAVFRQGVNHYAGCQLIDRWKSVIKRATGTPNRHRIVFSDLKFPGKDVKIISAELHMKFVEEGWSRIPNAELELYDGSIKDGKPLDVVQYRKHKVVGMDRKKKIIVWKIPASLVERWLAKPETNKGLRFQFTPDRKGAK